MGCFMRGSFIYNILDISSSLLGWPLSAEWPIVVLFFCFFPAGNLSRVVYPSFDGFSYPSCIAVVGSHFWFGRRLGSPFYCDASCLAVCILLAGPCQWSG